MIEQAFLGYRSSRPGELNELRDRDKTVKVSFPILAGEFSFQKSAILFGETQAFQTFGHKTKESQ